MLSKIIEIENVGRFRKAPAKDDSRFSKHTFVVGPNGYGKTTLCAILRSLQSGKPGHVTGRKTLGATGSMSVNLLLSTGVAKFDGRAWTTTLPGLAIFDGVFVGENVHSGEVVETDHKRNLYRVIIGEQGVTLAQEDSRLAAESRAKTTEITAAAKAIQSHVPAGMKLEQFIALGADPDIDTKIADQTLAVEACRQTSQLTARAALSEIVLPTLPADFGQLLARTLPDIAADAEERIAQHMAAHGMAEDGSTWIADGVPHASATCPFCGQDIQGLPLLAAYQAVFSERYEALKADLDTMHATVTRLFGAGAVGQLTTLAEQNRSGAEFWGRYCSLDAAALDFPVTAAIAVDALGKAALALLDRKIQRPLEAVPEDGTFTKAKAAYADADAAVKKVAETVRAANALIAARKIKAGQANLTTEEAELARRKAVQVRHTAKVAALCAEHTSLSAQKAAVDDQKAAVRVKLDAHTQRIVKPYEKLINQYLDDFNAGFSIAETKHTYAGGVATSSYQLVINKTRVDLGDSRTPAEMPSFKNTLSAGDRTTLALAFFLANLITQDAAALKQKVVVFDDPFNSQDAFRRLQTVHEIMRIAGACAQVIVLSHDPSFLKQVWKKAPPAERSSLQIYDAGTFGSRIAPIDLEEACQGRTATDIDDLVTYVTTGAGKPLDIIRKMRVVLEAYCRNTYPGSFKSDDWLGEMVGKIRDGGDAHPAAQLYSQLDQINDYTAQYHHGEDHADVTPDQIDATALKGYSRRTLRIINALQA